jgi:hypothetical protein
MITTPMDTNGIAIVQPVTGTNTPQHNEAYHKGYFLNDKARVSEIDGSELNVSADMTWSLESRRRLECHRAGGRLRPGDT